MHKPCVLLLFPTAADFCSSLVLVENAWTFGESILGRRKGHRSQSSWTEELLALLAEENLILYVWDILRTQSERLPHL